MQTRKAARVLPDPVGAATSTSCPAAMLRPRLFLGGVGPPGTGAGTTPPPPGASRQEGRVHGRPGREQGERHRGHAPILADGCDTQPGSSVRDVPGAAVG